VVTGSRGAGLARFWRVAKGLKEKRPSQSAKVVDMKRCRLVEFMGNHKGLGKNGRWRWYNDVEGERPFASKLSGNSNRPTRPSQAASVQVLTDLLWQKGQHQAGSPPNIPSR
jgi:hypothetical protein